MASSQFVLVILISYIATIFASPAFETRNIAEDNTLQLAGTASDEDATAESRSCGSCGHSPQPQPPPTFGGHHHTIPTFDFSGLLGNTKIMAFLAPILVLQIITLSLLAYLLKSGPRTSYPDSFIGSDFYALPTSSFGYDSDDSYSSYRSLGPSESTLAWLTERVSDGIDLYRRYQDHHNSV